MEHDPLPFELADAAPRACIGVFDSGVGGLSVLRALRAALPGTSMVYIGDVAHAPYGARPAVEVIERSMRMAEVLIGHGARLIVVACNTATVLAIEALRARWPERAFVGVEPGIKPAAARSRSKRIAVMATAATVASLRLRHLIERYAADGQVHLQACPGLADAIERGVLDGPALVEVLRGPCDAIRAAGVDTVVLGCTHYPFVEGPIRALLGEHVTLIDTASAIAARTGALWEQSLPLFEPSPTMHALSTGETATMRMLLRQCPGLAETEVETVAA